MITTAIGLASLMMSEMAPVRQFGFGAALGALVSLVVGVRRDTGRPDPLASERESASAAQSPFVAAGVSCS